MAEHRPEISVKIKRQLREEAGWKCANPGCANRRTALHHIREWAVYRTHDAKHMVAVCPTCHDAVHHGELPITDADIYRWKSAGRSAAVIRDHVYVEPGDQKLTLLGSIAFTSSLDGKVVFELSNANRLSFRFLDNDILLLGLRVADLTGRDFCHVVDNHVKHEPRPEVEFLRIPGHFQVTAPARPPYVPDWAIDMIREKEPMFALDGRFNVVSAQVIRPGVVRVEGVWIDGNYGAAITASAIHFLSTGYDAARSMSGHGEATIVHANGKINDAVFVFPSDPLRGHYEGAGGRY